MNNKDSTRLARLRPEKLDDVAVNDHILMIQKACGNNISTEKIALIFHECDYNMQQTIARIRAGDLEDGEWQTAKSNNKKKNYDHKLNGNTLSDGERSLSQCTSPTSSLRDERRKKKYYQYTSFQRPNTKRRENDSDRNNSFSSNLRFSSRTNSTNKLIQSNLNQPSSIAKQFNDDEQLKRISSSIDEYEFSNDITKSLSFDNSQIKISLQTSSKHRISSSTIPQEPVSMHPTVQFSTEPIDIQFGDVQWNNSIPIAVSPSDHRDISNVLEHQDSEILSTVNTQNSEQEQGAQDTLSSNDINHQITDNSDNKLLETTINQISSLSMTDNNSNNLLADSSEGTSHLSDHLTDKSDPVQTQYSSEQQVPVQIPIKRLSSTLTPRVSEISLSTSSFIPNHLQQTNNAAISSAFTPLNPLNNYPTIPQDYSQTANWNPHSSNYKIATKPTMISMTAPYQQQPSYHLPTPQQQILLGTYPYSSVTPTVFPIIASIDHWPHAGFSTPIESYPFQTTNYLSTYPNQQHYHHLPATKYEPHSFDKDFFTHYGQPHPSNNGTSSFQSQQQISTLSSSTKDTPLTSKLSPNAATFRQEIPIVASPSTPTAFYFNPVRFPVANCYSHVVGSMHQDRMLYSSLDNRDNHHGASYNSANDRNNYDNQGQQQQIRTHNNNESNSNWHLQQ